MIRYSLALVINFFLLKLSTVAVCNFAPKTVSGCEQLWRRSVWGTEDRHICHQRKKIHHTLHTGFRGKRACYFDLKRFAIGPHSRSEVMKPGTAL